MKKNYINPEVLVAHIALESMVLAGSPAGDQMGMSDIPTNDQW